jgi:hypothetical protein
VFHVGERFRITVTATNLTDRPLRIDARTGAPVYVRLSRFTGLYEEEFRAYPQAAIMIMSAWTLRGGQSKAFPIELTVEPDWPRGEAIRLAAELNGRPDVQPVVVITIAAHARPAAPPADSPKAAPASGPVQPGPTVRSAVEEPRPPASSPAKPEGAIKLQPYRSTPLTMPAP